MQGRPRISSPQDEGRGTGTLEGHWTCHVQCRWHDWWLSAGVVAMGVAPHKRAWPPPRPRQMLRPALSWGSGVGPRAREGGGGLRAGRLFWTRRGRGRAVARHLWAEAAQGPRARTREEPAGVQGPRHSNEHHSCCAAVLVLTPLPTYSPWLLSEREPLSSACAGLCYASPPPPLHTSSASASSAPPPHQLALWRTGNSPHCPPRRLLQGRGLGGGTGMRR